MGGNDSAKNFNTPIMFLKQNMSRGLRVTSYLMHACPRCNYFLCIIVRASSVDRTARSARGICIRCRYQLSWKLITGKRSAYSYNPDRAQTRILKLIKPAALGSPE